MDVTMGLIAGETATVGKIEAKVGRQVAAGDELAQVETAKGNLPIMAPCDGIVEDIFCTEGATVQTGEMLFRIREVASAPEAAPLCAKQTHTDHATDLLIIGAGPGGYVAAIYAAKHGLSVTLVEKESLGGTCLNHGCIPTKTLAKSSSVCKTLRKSTLFGINGHHPQVDMPRVIERKDAVKGQLVAGIRHLLRANGVTVLKGTASFVSANTVRVESPEQTCIVTAENVIIATGSQAASLHIPGSGSPLVLDSTAALAMTTLPTTLTIVGGGVIGMEFAFIYANFGVKVTVLEFLDTTLAMLDRDVSTAIEAIAEKKGLSIHTSARVVRIEEAINGSAVTVFEKDQKEHCVVSDYVLMAVGRQPHMAGLGLEALGITLHDKGRGVRVDTSMKTNVPHIYAVGDVTNTVQLAHVASHQGIVAVDNILGRSRSMNYDAIPNVIFTDPEIASVGKTAAECEQAGIACKTSRYPFYTNGKALTMDETEGFILLVQATDSGVILGGSVIGPDASSLVAALTLAVRNKLTGDDLVTTIFAHPTTGEALHECAMGLSIGALHHHE